MDSSLEEVVVEDDEKDVSVEVEVGSEEVDVVAVRI